MSGDYGASHTRFAWIIARPLTATRIFRLLEWASHGTFHLCVWAVLVTSESTLDPHHLFNQEDGNTARSQNIGVLWQLMVMDSNQNVVNIDQPFTASNLRRDWASAVFQYIGTTELTDGEITNAAIQIMQEHPLFNFLTNNSQNFAQHLLGKISPGSVCPDTIQQVLERWFPNNTKHNRDGPAALPGAYPIEHPTLVSEHWSTANSELVHESTPMNGDYSVPSFEEWEGDEIPYDTIKKHYKINWQLPLGQGSYGKVLEATHRSTQRRYAFKVINDSPDTMTELLAVRAVAMAQPQNPHVIRVYGFWYHKDEEQGISRTFIKMELCHGTLASFLDAKKTHGECTQPLELLEIMIHLLGGLTHCHGHRVCHRDLKPTNILYVNEPCPCHRSPLACRRRWLLTDFGFSTIFESNSMAFSCQRRGTNAFRAPELIGDALEVFGDSQPGVVSKQSDIWSIGCILFKVASTNEVAAFENDFSAAAFQKGRKGFDLPQLNESHNKALTLETFCLESECLKPLWQQVNSILRVCFARKPKDRPTAHALQNRFQNMLTKLAIETDFRAEC